MGLPPHPKTEKTEMSNFRANLTQKLEKTLNDNLAGLGVGDASTKAGIIGVDLPEPRVDDFHTFLKNHSTTLTQRIKKNQEKCGAVY